VIGVGIRLRQKTVTKSQAAEPARGARFQSMASP